jgi:hypothetical protein
MEFQRAKKNFVTNVIILRQNQDEIFYENCLKVLNNNYPLWVIDSELSEELKIIEYELTINQLLLQVIESQEIDQAEWEGKG